MRMHRVLILCTGNSCRSQLAEAIARGMGLEAHSAGTHPAREVHPLAVQAAREIGLDLSLARPKSVDEFTGQDFDFVITVCGEAERECPSFTGRVGKRTHIGFDDPARATGTEEQKMTVFRRVRDEIREKLTQYFEKESAL
jgi:arsenate reductase (thioredoxin)